MDISFYTLANALGITCAAAAFLFFLRRTARGQEENDDADVTAAQSQARTRQENAQDESANAANTPGSTADAARPPHAAPDAEHNGPTGSRP